MKQICKVRTDIVDGDEGGNEWKVHYILYELDEPTDYEGVHHKFEIYEDDGAGNGVFVCSGFSRRLMRGLILQLGEFVEWEEGSAP